jgi:hypothetical protein
MECQEAAMRRLFRNLFTQAFTRPARTSRCAAPRPGVNFRPRVELLEAREVPALFTWTGAVSTSASDPLNWQTAVPNTLPGPDDDVVFTAMSSGYHNCVDLGSAYEQLKSLTLEAGYDGTVYVVQDSSLTVGTFTLAGGAIAQPAPSTPLEVTGTFTWTGGVLNSLANGAYIFLDGGGSITLPTGGTLTCGSVLSFGSSTGQLMETIISGAGTLLLNGTNQNAINVGGNAGVISVNNVDAQNFDVINGVKTLTLDANSYWGFAGSGTRRFGFRVVNNGGKFFLGDPDPNQNWRAQVTIQMTGGTVTDPAYIQGTVANQSPKLQIMSGCVMDVGTSYASIAGGNVWIVGNTDLGANGQTATIKGKYVMAGGAIGFLTQLGNQNVWCKFRVDGDVLWSGGQFQPGINCDANAQAGDYNQWLFTGTMTVDTSGTSKPTIVPVPQFGSPPTDKTWDVILADPNNANSKIVLKQGSTDPDVSAGWSLRPKIDGGVKKGYGVQKNP